jgi:predicted PurR-regulated permease PerM
LPAWASALVMTLGVVVLVLGPVVALAIGCGRDRSSALIAELTGGRSCANPWTAWCSRCATGVPFVDRFASPEELLGLLKSGLASVSGAVSRAALRWIQAFPVVALQLALVALSTYFSLLDGKSLYRWIGEKLPLSLQIQNMLAASFQSATRAVVLASVAAAGTQAAVILGRLHGSARSVRAAGGRAHLHAGMGARRADARVGSRRCLPVHRGLPRSRRDHWSRSGWWSASSTTSCAPWC